MSATTTGRVRLKKGPNRLRDRKGRKAARSKNTRSRSKKSKEKTSDSGKKPAKPRKTGDETGRARLREGAGVVLAALASAALLSLVSYAPEGETGNLIGPLGDAAAFGLLRALGLLAYPVVVSAGAGAALLVLGHKPKVKVAEALGILGAAPASAVLLALLGPEMVQGHSPGGALGAWLGAHGVSVLSVVGTCILAGAAVVVCLMLSADVRPSKVAQWIFTGVWSVIRPMGSAARRIATEVREEWVARREARAARAAREEAELLSEPVLDDHLGDFEEEVSWSDGLDEEDDAAVVEVAEGDDDDGPVIVTPTDDEPLQVSVGDIVALHDLPPGETGEIDAADTLADVPAPEVDSEEAEQAAEPEQQELHLAPKIIAREAREDDAGVLPPEFADFGGSRFQLPPLRFLESEEQQSQESSWTEEELLASAAKLEQKLADYGVKGQVVEIHPGPVITMYEFKPAPGTRVSKIARLADDLAMALEAVAVRIVAPIPGKPVVGIEIPNHGRETVWLREIIANGKFGRHKSRLAIALGKDIAGEPVCMDLAKMPHLLVAGATGAGKSVCLNSIVMSFLYKSSPDEVRMLMIDPKMLEFGIYDGIPHLLHPVVTDPKKATIALRWAVEEMERRYQLLAEAGVRKIDNYNKRVEKKLDELEAKGVDVEDLAPEDQPRKLPHIVVMVDELADLMMVASRDVETSIARLAQMARAAGIHVILATQRPSVDVITGMIKANFPTRFAFKVATRTDSRTIVDENGAEHLLGRGDMLVMKPGSSKLERVHGAFVSEDEVARVVEFLKEQAPPQYDKEILRPRDDDGAPADEDDDKDELYDRAVSVAAEAGKISISMLQRKMKVGYNRAARMVDRMERDGVVGPQGAAGKPREVLIAAH